MDETPPLPAWAGAWSPAFEDIERTLELTEGFSLLPVQVAAPQVARALAAWFGVHGRAVELIDAATTATLAAALLELPRGFDRVLVVGGDDAAGRAFELQQFNRSRDAVRDHLACPLLWCGTAAFHEATWENAPDFWSVRDLTVRLLAPRELAATSAPPDATATEASWAAVRAGGCREAIAWRTVGAELLRGGAEFDGSACLEVALVLDDSPSWDQTLGWFLGATGFDAPSTWSVEDAINRAERGRVDAPEMRYLLARLVERARQGSLSPDACESALRVLGDGAASVSRFAWWLAVSHVGQGVDPGPSGIRPAERAARLLRWEGMNPPRDLPMAVLDASARAKVHALVGLWEVAQRAGGEGHLPSLPAYLRAVFAVGFARLGEVERGRTLAAFEEAELDEVGPANRALLERYSARFEHEAKLGTSGAWGQKVASHLRAISEPRVRDRVEWLRKRSGWLAGDERDPPPTSDERYRGDPGVRAALRMLGNSGPMVRELIRDDGRAPELVLREIRETSEGGRPPGVYVFDFELIAMSVVALDEVTRERGDDALGVALREGEAILRHIRHPGHVCELLGALIRCASMLGDLDAIEGYLTDVLALAERVDGPAVRDLNVPIRALVTSLRCIGGGASRSGNLARFEALAPRGHREGIQLRASLASWAKLVNDEARAERLMAECLSDLSTGQLDHVGRNEVGAAVLWALRDWPLSARAEHVARILTDLARFTDRFTASAQGVYETHKILIAERIVDCMTAPDEREAAWLEAQRRMLLDRVLRTGT